MRARTRWLLAVALTVAVVAGAQLRAAPPHAVRRTGAAPVVATSTTRAADALRVWDDRRAAAWVDDDAVALRALYVRGSLAGRHDLAMLAAYHRRGLRVTGMQRQVLALRVHRSTPGRLVLVVTDRLAAARAGDGRLRWPLPPSRAETRTIELRRVAGRWRVGEVYSARARPAASTATTSGSRNS